MKNVIAKVNAKGAVVFYRDGKRISRASLTAAYVDEARAEMTRQGVDVASEFATGEDNKDGFIVEIRLIVPVACDRWVGSHADIDASFTVNVETVTTGLQVMKAARGIDNFARAGLYDAYEYAASEYDRWHMTRGALILHSNGGRSVTKTYGRVFEALVDAFSNAGFKPVTDWQKAKADLDEADKQVDIARERRHECQQLLHSKREYRDKAIIANALSLTA